MVTLLVKNCGSDFEFDFILPENKNRKQHAQKRKKEGSQFKIF